LSEVFIFIVCTVTPPTTLDMKFIKITKKANKNPPKKVEMLISKLQFFISL
jgi:hypothetical protein